jgi:nitroreductase
MPTVPASTIIDQLKWRYATKKFDPAKKVSPADFAVLEQAVQLAPSSFGLSPWKFIVVTDPALKEKLTAVSWNQPQIKDCSHLVVFAVRKGIDAAYVQKFIDRVGEVRHMPTAPLDGYKQMMVGTISSMTPAQVDEWSSKQVYIALGFLLSAAAMLEIDACPMEGIDKAKYDEILGLSAQGLGALCVAAVGYRSADDQTAKYAKVRFDAKDVVTHIA